MKKIIFYKCYITDITREIDDFINNTEDNLISIEITNTGSEDPDKNYKCIIKHD